MLYYMYLTNENGGSKSTGIVPQLFTSTKSTIVINVYRSWNKKVISLVHKAFMVIPFTSFRGLFKMENTDSLNLAFTR